ncbi:hypothetical protein XFHB_13570 [Xylella fastidiosa]|uniref:Uncharacterized protein n=1 Tax=Xylella fastidiosa TaxID=2371 RepID=A0ABD7BYX4_XYLFS|nr:hypothetical protein [Xylella fastidiosa]QPB72685.1 hypothetical protein XFHB_13570 [Xylella fastidiosa]
MLFLVQSEHVLHGAFLAIVGVGFTRSTWPSGKISESTPPTSAVTGRPCLRQDGGW